jgi:hypothetical protein
MKAQQAGKKQVRGQAKMRRIEGRTTGSQKRRLTQHLSVLDRQ